VQVSRENVSEEVKEKSSELQKVMDDFINMVTEKVR